MEDTRRLYRKWTRILETIIKSLFILIGLNLTLSTLGLVGLSLVPDPTPEEMPGKKV